MDLALRSDLVPQAECRHQLLLEDRLLPVATPAVLAQPAAERTILHGELDWHHWTLKGERICSCAPRGSASPIPACCRMPPAPGWGWRW